MVWGIGIGHVDLFNQIMLAKLAWYMIQHLDNLGHALLMDKYFHETSILDASKGKRPTYLWTSILWERQLLRAGLD